MNTIKPQYSLHTQLSPPFKPRIFTNNNSIKPPAKISTARGKAKAASDGGEKRTERRSFLTLEEAGLVEISGLSPHERFLCRLTISSLNLLRVISEQEGCGIEELNAGRVCDWFIKDKLKREQNLDSAVLQWDDSEFFL
ncbi:receptor-interacting protein [Perilla frutescens var. hirtella]|uniref:Receptor-interacting protein n=1 Tax=Perilla frutescens var. hirtella TaxID=608512 RepID=A0AAD4JID3_PERFH|nr:receptor-interacting protein [Perilla frutescens var. hirtella]